MHVLQTAIKLAKEQHGIDAELINLRTLLPWDVDTVVNSVKKTGRLIISHEAPKVCGLGAEISATIQVRYRLFFLLIIIHWFLYPNLQSIP